MRPRVFPAEDVMMSVPSRLRIARCFNEAAGIPRGRHAYWIRRLGKPRASMRPRVFPAEDEERKAKQRAFHDALQ